MRNKVFEKISNNFKLDENLFLLLGDLGVFQSKEAFRIDNYRCINYGIMEQSMISFAAGISMAKSYPIVYSITPFIIERCYEQIKLDFNYNKSKGLFISAGGSFDYNKLGPTHYCPNDISFMIKANCKNIFLPWNESQAERFIEEILQKKDFTYLRLSSEEIDEKNIPLNISKLNTISSKKDLVLGIGPDSYLMSNKLNYKIDLSANNINQELINNILNIIFRGINLTIIAGFNLDFLLNLIKVKNNTEQNITESNGELSLIYSRDTKYDSAEKKITHLMSNLCTNNFILK